MQVEIEWHKALSEDGKWVRVMARLVGTEYVREFDPVPVQVADAFIQAKRNSLARSMLTRAGAIKIFSDPKQRF